jgi:phosphate transport system substrate-binding protein
MAGGASTGGTGKIILIKMKHNKWVTRVLAGITLLAFLLGNAACKDKKSNTGKEKIVEKEDFSKGTIRISADESFQPVIEAQLEVYRASYPNANITVSYKPEAECIKDLANDSIRMVFVSRGLNEEELKYFTDTLKYAPPFDKMAMDAVAIIVNNKSGDTSFTMDEIRSLLDGSSAMNKEVVFDGLSATSTVRFALDSILKGKPFGKNIKAAQGTEKVIDYVASHENAIGLVGTCWVGDRSDATQKTYLQKVKVCWVECTKCKGDTFVMPNQLSIATGQYPLVRGLYFIIKENYFGLGSGLVNFMIHERGQLIFRRAYLVPDRMPFYIRKANLEE